MISHDAMFGIQTSHIIGSFPSQSHSVCRARCTTDNNAASRTLTRTCIPVGLVGGGPNLRSSAGFVYFPPTSTPPPLFPSFLIVYLHNKLFLTPEHEEPFQSISLRARAEIYVKRQTLVNGRVNANDVWFLDLINAVYTAPLRLLHGSGS